MKNSKNSIKQNFLMVVCAIIIALTVLFVFGKIDPKNKMRDTSGKTFISD